jgi:hypothetical protein
MNPRALRLGLILLAIAGSVPGFAGDGSAACLAAPQERASVSAIADRSEIVLADGRRARLAGLDVPDSGRGDPALAASARAWLTTHLLGRQIGLRLLVPTIADD